MPAAASEKNKRDRHEQQAIFKCPLCDAKLQTKKSLKRHRYLVHDPSAKRFSCTRCTSRFTSQSELLRHLRVHSDARPFRCSECPLSFKNEGTLRAHSQWKHANQTCVKFICSICQRSFAVRNMLTRHIETHDDLKRYQCPLCSARFKSPGGCRRHQQSHDAGDERIFPCHICGTKFASALNVKRHAKSVHHSHKPRKCVHCFAFFKSAWLAQHVRLCQKRGELSVTCAQCECKLTNKFSLANHIKAVHSLKKDFGCAQCGCRFLARTGLIKHIQGMHLSRQARSAAYGCAWCLKSYTSRSALTDHFSLAHRAVLSNPFYCRICKSSFRTAYSLKMHHRIKHTCASFAKCDICGATFRSASGLTYHQRSAHSPRSPEMLFRCEKCPKSFRLKANLTQHCNRYHKRARMTCSQCSASFWYASSIRAHIRIQHNPNFCKPFKCYQCSATFSRSGYLKSHLFVHLDAARPFTCARCCYATVTLDRLRLHLRKCAAKAWTRACRRGVRLCNPGSANSFGCARCDKAYSSPYLLRDHIVQRHYNNM